LLIVAVAIGAVLLNRAGSTPSSLSSVRSSSPTTAKPGKGHPTTTVPTPSTSAVPAVRPPSEIKVLVANSTPVGGQAGRYTTVVRNFGYNALPAVDSTVRGLRTSVVYYQPGYNAEAAVLATKLGLPKSAVQPMPATPPVVNLGSANILLVVGLDLATAPTTPGGATATTGVRQAPATAPPHTTTTTHP
jgi:hypothetical protein